MGDVMDLEGLRDWLDRYFGAWASNDSEEVAALFAEDAVYRYGPGRDPSFGRDAIVREWVSNPPQEDLRFEYEPLAVSDRRGIAHWRTSFREGETRVELDGVLVLDFDPEGRCTEHREWYFRRRSPA